MTGKDLYQLWVEANSMNGVSVDSWDDVEEVTVQIWEDLADLVHEEIQ